MILFFILVTVHKHIKKFSLHLLVDKPSVSHGVSVLFFLHIYVFA
jgi:hypothetical protein